MKKFLSFLLLTALLGTASVSVAAQEIRIGFINTDRIFKEANTAKQAQAKLEQEFSKREKELNVFGSNLKTGVEKFEREAPTLSESRKSDDRIDFDKKHANKLSKEVQKILKGKKIKTKDQIKKYFTPISKSKDSLFIRMSFL